MVHFYPLITIIAHSETHREIGSMSSRNTITHFTLQRKKVKEPKKILKKLV